MRNTIVEMVARAGRLDVLLNNVHGEKEMHWVNGHPVSRLYRRAASARSCSLQAAHQRHNLTSTHACDTWLTMHAGPQCP